jgi:hypothetical protein
MSSFYRGRIVTVMKKDFIIYYKNYSDFICFNDAIEN